uniref:RNA-dependent RNA polymerase n=1 Tax=Tonghua Narna tick virus 4 TaxID=2972245 RepID=A0A9E7V1Y9_9VIRU|nr:MAG: RNA-dependent RNA polymerase [Tonghua Narna tick virus 4]
MSETSDDVDVNRHHLPQPWEQGDVLSLKSFPGTGILRYGRFRTHLCKCTENQRHRSLFDLNLLYTGPNLLGTKDCPEISVCHNAENIWECKLPREITGLTNRVTFNRLPNVRTALAVLKRGTYWYPQLAKGKFKECSFTRKIARLLGGYSSCEGREPFGTVKNRKLSAPAVQRLRSLLATVDGLLLQVCLAFPGSTQFQNWDRIDQIQRCLIAQILDDFFKDINPERVLTFEKVKRLRKEIKMAGFNPTKTMSDVDIPRELSALRVALSLIRGKTPLSHLQVMIMSQTRASGVPPRAVYDRTIAKTKAILTTPSSKELYQLVSGPLTRSVDHFYSDLLIRLKGEDLRNLFFESVAKSAKISLSDSGEFFTTTDKGGKLERSRIVLQTNPEIREVDLHTGLHTGKVLTASNSKQGERLFHWALNAFRDRQNVYNNNCMSCRISLVAELGKYRTITVSTLQHALLLHPFSHMGLKILEAIPSSESGIGAANQAWNFFKRLSHKNPSASFIFNEKIETSVHSTDWESATDYCDPYIAGAMLNRFCYLLGVPQWYRETMLFALTGPRQVETLDRNGAPIEVFYTSRGVLMGDPVTKIVLHLHHLIGAKIAGLLLQDVFKDNILDEDSDSESD